MSALALGGIDFADVNRTLEEEGIGKFTKSLDKLLGVIADKRESLSQNARVGDNQRSKQVLGSIPSDNQLSP